MSGQFWDLFLAALLGFAIGMLYQEFHFRAIKRALEDAERRLDALEARAASEAQPLPQPPEDRGSRAPEDRT